MPTPLSRGHCLVVITTIAIVGVGIGALAWWKGHDHERTTFLSDLQRMCRDRAIAVDMVINTTQSSMYALGQVFSAVEPEEEVMPAKIMHLSSSLAGALGVGANEILWAPKIRSARGRRVFEETRLQGNNSDYENTECVFHLTDNDKNGFNRTCAPALNSSFPMWPVEFALPSQPSIIGWDLSEVCPMPSVPRDANMNKDGIAAGLIHWTGVQEESATMDDFVRGYLNPLYPSLKFRQTLSSNCSEPFSGDDYSITFGTRIARDLELGHLLNMTRRQRRDYQIKHTVGIIITRLNPLQFIKRANPTGLLELSIWDMSITADDYMNHTIGTFFTRPNCVPSSKGPMEIPASPVGLIARYNGGGDAQWEIRHRLSAIAPPWYLVCRPHQVLIDERITALPFVWGFVGWAGATLLGIIMLMCYRYHLTAVRYSNRLEMMLAEVRQAKEFAEKSATDKSNFMAFLCHELRNPLHSIDGMVELLLEPSSNGSSLLSLCARKRTKSDIPNNNNNNNNDNTGNSNVNFPSSVNSAGTNVVTTPATIAMCHDDDGHTSESDTPHEVAAEHSNDALMLTSASSPAMAAPSMATLPVERDDRDVCDDDRDNSILCRDDAPPMHSSIQPLSLALPRVTRRDSKYGGDRRHFHHQMHYHSPHPPHEAPLLTHLTSESSVSQSILPPDTPPYMSDSSGDGSDTTAAAPPSTSTSSSSSSSMSGVSSSLLGGYARTRPSYENSLLSASMASLTPIPSDNRRDDSYGGDHINNNNSISRSINDPSSVNSGNGNGNGNSNDEASDTAIDYLRAIRCCSALMLAIVNDVLEMEKLQAGKGEVISTPFDLHEVIRSVITVYRSRSRAHGLRVRADLSAGTPKWVCGDPTRLRQIITNLVGNSVKFTSEGFVIVRVIPIAPPPSSQTLYSNSPIRLPSRSTHTSSPHGTRAVASVTTSPTTTATVPATASAAMIGHSDIVVPVTSSPILTPQSRGGNNRYFGRASILGVTERKCPSPSPLMVHTQAGSGVEWIRFEVQDSGIGIAPQMITTLFTPYTQASHSVGRQHGGSGLGLSIVKRLVELMGGNVSVTSTEGKGTTMTVDLPFGKWVEPDHLDGAPRTPQHKSPSHSRRPYTPPIPNRGDQQQHDTLCHTMATGTIDAPMSPLALTRSNSNNAPSSSLLTSTMQSSGTCSGTGASSGSMYGSVISPSSTKSVSPSLLSRSFRDHHGSSSSLSSSPSHQQQQQHRIVTYNNHVLLVEDNLVNQKLVARILTRAGFLVDVASDGSQVLHKFDSFDPTQSPKYGVILMDLNMPVLNGYDTCSELRQRGVTIPIVALSANVLREGRQRCLDVGMSGFLSKPAKPAQIIEAVRQYMPQPPHHQSYHSYPPPHRHRGISSSPVRRASLSLSTPNTPTGIGTSSSHGHGNTASSIATGTAPANTRTLGSNHTTASGVMNSSNTDGSNHLPPPILTPTSSSLSNTVGTSVDVPHFHGGGSSAHDAAHLTSNNTSDSATTNTASHDSNTCGSSTSPLTQRPWISSSSSTCSSSSSSSSSPSPSSLSASQCHPLSQSSTRT